MKGGGGEAGGLSLPTDSPAVVAAAGVAGRAATDARPPAHRSTLPSIGIQSVCQVIVGAAHGDALLAGVSRAAALAVGGALQGRGGGGGQGGGWGVVGGWGWGGGVGGWGGAQRQGAISRTRPAVWRSLAGSRRQCSGAVGAGRAAERKQPQRRRWGWGGAHRGALAGVGVWEKEDAAFDARARAACALQAVVLVGALWIGQEGRGR